jgi:PAS domain S-box-containing protein
VVLEAVCLIGDRVLFLTSQAADVVPGRQALWAWALAVAGMPFLTYAVWRVSREQASERQVNASLRTVSRTSREWLWAIDSAGVFTFSGPASREFVGYEPAELLGQPCSLVMDPAEVARARAAMLTGTEGESGWAGLVVACRRRDGTTTWVDVSGLPRHDFNGRVVGFDATSRLLGAEANAIALEQIRARVEAVLAGRLLVTAFQPIVSADTGDVVGAEALSRFTHEWGSAPEVWFADAASVGLGVELELLAVQTALARVQELPEHLYVSFNMSPTTCMNLGLIGVLDRSPVPGARLVVELTEHASVADYPPLAAALGRLRQRGLRFAVDDAGAGYASFRHILRLKPDIIKLDREILAGIDTDPARRALGAAVAMFASDIGATVIAEGIETQAELAAVTALGMPAVQGYLLGGATLNPAEWARWQPRRIGRTPSNT